MHSLALSAAVSAVVTVVVGTLINWGEKTVTGLRRWVTPDHLPMASGGGWLASSTTSSTDQVRVLITCAPNRSLRRRLINPDHAVDLIRSNFGDIFPAQPIFSMPEHGVRFECGSGPSDGYAWAHTAGRIDLCVNIATTSADDGSITISILDVISVLLRVLNAMRSEAYSTTYGRRLPGLRRKFDWGIGVSPTVVLPSVGSRSWDIVTFPGEVPSRAGSQQQAYCPPAGYAADQLRNWDVRREDKDLVRVFLRDFLYQNGYHNIDTSVAQTLAALSSLDLRFRLDHSALTAQVAEPAGL